MKLFEKLKLFFSKNRKLIFYILDELRQCVPEKDWEAYYQQISCIEKIQWVLDKEVDLYYHSDCKDNKLFNKEFTATVLIESKDKTYKIKIFAINGKIFSLESNIPFKKLRIQDVSALEIQCHNFM